VWDVFVWFCGVLCVWMMAVVVVSSLRLAACRIPLLISGTKQQVGDSFPSDGDTLLVCSDIGSVSADGVVSWPTAWRGPPVHQARVVIATRLGQELVPPVVLPPASANATIPLGSAVAVLELPDSTPRPLGAAASGSGGGGATPGPGAQVVTVDDGLRVCLGPVSVRAVAITGDFGATLTVAPGLPNATGVGAGGGWVVLRDDTWPASQVHTGRFWKVEVVDVWREGDTTAELQALSLLAAPVDVGQRGHEVAWIVDPASDDASANATAQRAEACRARPHVASATLHRCSSLAQVTFGAGGVFSTCVREQGSSEWRTPRSSQLVRVPQVTHASNCSRTAVVSATKQVELHGVGLACNGSSVDSDQVVDRAFFAPLDDRFVAVASAGTSATNDSAAGELGGAGAAGAAGAGAGAAAHAACNNATWAETAQVVTCAAGVPSDEVMHDGSGARAVVDVRTANYTTGQLRNGGVGLGVGWAVLCYQYAPSSVFVPHLNVTLRVLHPRSDAAVPLVGSSALAVAGVVKEFVYEGVGMACEDNVKWVPVTWRNESWVTTANVTINVTHTTPAVNGTSASNATMASNTTFPNATSPNVTTPYRNTTTTTTATTTTTTHHHRWVPVWDCSQPDAFLNASSTTASTPVVWSVTPALSTPFVFPFPIAGEAPMAPAAASVSASNTSHPPPAVGLCYRFASHTFQPVPHATLAVVGIDTAVVCPGCGDAGAAVMGVPKNWTLRGTGVSTAHDSVRWVGVPAHRVPLLEAADADNRAGRPVNHSLACDPRAIGGGGGGGAAGGMSMPFGTYGGNGGAATAVAQLLAVPGAGNVSSDGTQQQDAVVLRASFHTVVPPELAPFDDDVVIMLCYQFRQETPRLYVFHVCWLRECTVCVRVRVRFGAVVL